MKKKPPQKWRGFTAAPPQQEPTTRMMDEEDQPTPLSIVFSRPTATPSSTAQPHASTTPAPLMTQFAPLMAAMNPQTAQPHAPFTPSTTPALMTQWAPLFAALDPQTVLTMFKIHEGEETKRLATHEEEETKRLATKIREEEETKRLATKIREEEETKRARLRSSPALSSVWMEPNEQKSQHSMRSQDQQQQWKRDILNFQSRIVSSDRTVVCMVSGQKIPEALSKAMHLWPFSKQDRLTEVNLTPNDVWSLRNGLVVANQIEEYYDRRQLCLLYNPLSSPSSIRVVVLDPSILDKPILTTQNGHPTTSCTLKFRDIDKKEIPTLKHMVYRRILGKQANEALQIAREYRWKTVPECDELEKYVTLSNGVDDTTSPAPPPTREEIDHVEEFSATSTPQPDLQQQQDIQESQ